MNKKFSKILSNWYSVHKRDLPWRTTKNPYKVWLSEVILQQTQVKQGLPYYESFIKRFPDVHSLANSTEDEVLKEWQGLGYYSRARNLHAAAKYISEDLKGVFPNTYKDLIKLKGVGDYTASAIASICFEENCAVVDGNVYRVLSRIYGIDTPINTTEGIKQFKTLAQQLLPESSIGDHNQAIMEFGAKQCKPQSPDCKVCVFQAHCKAFEMNLIKKLPVKKKITKLKKRYFNYLVFVDSKGNTVLRKRKGKGIWQNLFEFPLIESEKSLKFNDLKKMDSFQRETLNLEFHLVDEPKELLHRLSHQHLYVKFWVLKTKSSLNRGIKSEKLIEYALPVVIDNFIKECNFTSF